MGILFGLSDFQFQGSIFLAAFALTCYKCDSSQSKLCNYGIGSFTYDTVNCDEEAGGGVLTNWIPKQCVKLVAKGAKRRFGLWG